MKHLFAYNFTLSHNLLLTTLNSIHMEISIADLHKRYEEADSGKIEDVLNTLTDSGGYEKIFIFYEDEKDINQTLLKKWKHVSFISAKHGVRSTLGIESPNNTTCWLVCGFICQTPYEESFVPNLRRQGYDNIQFLNIG